MNPGALPNRREFLSATAAAAAVAGLPLGRATAATSATPKAVTIARIETFPLLHPVVGPFQFFERSDGRPSGRPVVLVKVTASDGTVGWGRACRRRVGASNT